MTHLDVKVEFRMHRPHVNGPGRKGKNQRGKMCSGNIINALHARSQSISDGYTPNGNPPVLRPQRLLHHAQVIKSTTPQGHRCFFHFRLGRKLGAVILFHVTRRHARHHS